MSREENPEKGNKVLVGMVIVLHTLNHMVSGGLPILYPDIMNEFSLSYSQLGLIRSAATFSAGFPQMFVGVLRRWMSGRVLIGGGQPDQRGAEPADQRQPGVHPVLRPQRPGRRGEQPPAPCGGVPGVHGV
ncbi:MAG: hypothetical protein ABIJ47_01815 [Candidatus Bathyarchaeota archaeon]